MERILRLRTWLEGHRPVLFEWLRIYLGVGLFMRGVWFFTHSGAVGEFLQGSQWQLPFELFVGNYIGVAHLAGGAMLALGLLTRLAAAVQVPVLLGAVFAVHLRGGFSTANPSLEFALLILFLLVLMVFHGGGRWSLDAWLAREYEAHQPTEAR